MEKWQWPEEECWDGKTDEKENVPEDGVMMEIDDIVLNGGSQPSIDPDKNPNQRCTKTSDRSAESLPPWGPVSSNRLAFV